jgi:(4S)-4-hydroxy-5-phosphonooxypentane-2,3-dione isomerase
MFVRIVKLTFREETTADFSQLFEERKSDIRNQPGCTGLRLLRDRNDPRIFFTYSHWNDESDLENYRKSELFTQVWGTVKTWFADRPEAWSVDVLHEL